jgi:hypothetical protein
MPCRYCSGPFVETPSTKVVKETVEVPDPNVLKENKLLKKELDRVTALLCAVCKNGVPKVSGLEKWWKEHQVKDKAREEKQALRLEIKKLKKALANLGKKQ